jgi:hypothetical protein
MQPAPQFANSAIETYKLEDSSSGTTGMTIIEDLALVDAHHAVSVSSSPRDQTAVLATLRSGWDIWQRSDRDDRFGMARNTHLAIVEGIDVTKARLRPVLAAGMSDAELEAGIWRQLRIFPDETDRTSGDAPGTESDCAPYAVHASRPAPRAEYVIALTGHSPRDMAEFLFELHADDEKQGRLVMGKSLKTVLRLHPELIDRPWPDSVLERWRKANLRSHANLRDHMPPIRAAGIFAELSRLAQNVHAHARLSFDDNGNEIFLRGYLDGIAALPDKPETTYAISRALQMAPFLSTALVPPDRILLSVNESRCARWSKHAASAAAMAITIAGDEGLRDLAVPLDRETAGFLRDGIGKHPRFWPTSHSNGRYCSKGYPMTFRGLTLRQHAIAGLLQIAAQARAWSIEHRTGPERLKKVNRDTERAIAAIFYLWLESAHRPALDTALAPVIDAKTDHVGRVPQEDRTIAAIALGANFGQKLCREVREVMRTLPRLGEEGYTAWYHAHLWFDSSGDDFAHYAAHQKTAIKRHNRLLRRRNELIRLSMSRAPQPASARDWNPAVSTTLDTALPDTSRMTYDPHVARSAQNCAMMMLPPSTDPIFAVNAAPGRWIDHSSPAQSLQKNKQTGSARTTYAHSGVASPLVRTSSGQPSSNEKRLLPTEAI